MESETSIFNSIYFDLVTNSESARKWTESGSPKALVIGSALYGRRISIPEFAWLALKGYSVGGLDGANFHPTKSEQVWGLEHASALAGKSIPLFVSMSEADSSGIPEILEKSQEEVLIVAPHPAAVVSMVRGGFKMLKKGGLLTVALDRVNLRDRELPERLQVACRSINFHPVGAYSFDGVGWSEADNNNVFKIDYEDYIQAGFPNTPQLDVTGGKIAIMSFKRS